MPAHIAHAPSLTIIMNPTGVAVATIPQAASRRECHQMQRRPRLRCAAYESMTRNVIARIETIEIHAHTSKLVTAVIGERAYPLVGLAALALFDE